MKLGFIGLGNMAKALLGGILSGGIAEAEDIYGSAATDETRKAVAKQFGIHTDLSNSQVVKQSDVVILAVKPQYLSVVLEEIRESVDEKKLLISEIGRAHV